LSIEQGHGPSVGRDPSAPVAVLGCEDVRVAYGSTIALDGVSLAWYQPGEVHAVVGQNGAGKTTLCRVLAGMVRAERGEVVVEGHRYPASAPAQVRRGGVELVHQTFALPPSFTVAEALALFRPEHGHGGFFSRRAIERRWSAKLEELGFRVDASATVRDLPPEQLQAVEITRALASGSRVIVLDEPTAVLPPEAVEGLFERLRALAGQGITFLVVMHKLRQVREIAQSVAVLAGGRVVLEPTAMSEIADTEIARLIMAGTGAGAAAEVAMGLRDGADGLDGAGSPATTAEHSPRAAASLGEVVLTVERVSTASREGYRGLRRFGVEVRSGEIVGIAGVEGNGQVALVDAIVGTEPISAGVVRLAGTDAGKLRIAERRRLGLRYIPADRQSRAVSLSSSLWANAMAAPVVSGYGLEGVARRGYLSERRLRRAGQERLERWRVRYSSADQSVRELSGGNMQRVVLARELDDGARLIVAEQPTQGLDLGGTELVWDALRQAKAKGAGVLLVSSDLDELFALADRLVVIADGEAVSEARPPFDREAIGQAMVAGVLS
jgi:ABC-type uncharacterized transport system ATPase subunit